MHVLPAVHARDPAAGQGYQRVNQGQSERQWDCKQRVTQRRHRIGLGRINWNALFRMVYSVLVEWNASSLTRAMAGGAGLHGRLACNGWWRGVGACNGWRRRVAWQPPSRECRLSEALGGHSEGQCTCESKPKARGRCIGGSASRRRCARRAPSGGSASTRSSWPRPAALSAGSQSRIRSRGRS